MIDKITRGLNIFKKYSDVSLGAEHDILYVHITGLSDKDATKLNKLGWYYEPDDDYWSIFI